MYFDPRGILFFGANALLLHLSLMVNSALAGSSLYLFLLGPMLVLPALYMRHSAYFLCTLASGLLIDAALPLPHGVYTLSFLAAGALVFFMRMRFRAENNYHPSLIAHAVNLLLIAITTLPSVGTASGALSFWPQIALTVALSHLVLLLVAPWFFNLQRLLLELLHLDPSLKTCPCCE